MSHRMNVEAQRDVNRRLQDACSRVGKAASLHGPEFLHLSYAVVLSSPPAQSGKFGGATSDTQESQPQGIQYAEDAAEHENMKAVLKSSLQGGESGTSTVPGLRTRTRASSVRGQSQTVEAPL